MPGWRPSQHRAGPWYPRELSSSRDSLSLRLPPREIEVPPDAPRNKPCVFIWCYLATTQSPVTAEPAKPSGLNHGNHRQCATGCQTNCAPVASPLWQIPPTCGGTATAWRQCCKPRGSKENCIEVLSAPDWWDIPREPAIARSRTA